MRRFVELGKEERIASRDDPLGREKSRLSMIRVEAIALPRVMCQDNLGSETPDPESHLASLLETRSELTVRPAEEDDVVSPSELSCRPLLLELSFRYERLLVGRWIPGSFRAVGADQVEDLTA